MKAEVRNLWNVFRRLQVSALHIHDGMVTDFLVARPTFFSGMARVLDLGATFHDYNKSRTPDEADLRALYADWVIVGRDMRASMDAYAEQHPDQAKLVSVCKHERGEPTYQAAR